MKTLSLRGCVLASLSWTCSISSLAQASASTTRLRQQQQKQKQRNLQCPPGSWGGCSDTNGDTPACFSAHATVSMLGQGSVAMQDLQIGDKVLTGKNGSYGTVYTFGHANVDTPTQFIQIHVVGRKAPLEMTPEHLVFLYGQRNPVRADTVQVGDSLQADKSLKATVRKVSKVTRKGFYAPFTKEGTIVVNGIVSSQYAAFQNHEFRGEQQMTTIEIMGLDTGISQHTLGHLAFSPLRLLCLGISSEFCEFDKNHGTHSHVAIGIKVYDWAHSSSSSNETILLRQCLVLLLGLFLVVPCFLLESCFDAEWAPSITLLVVIVSMYVWGMRHHMFDGIRAKTKVV